MIMKLNINDRAALAIKNNTKRVEINDELTLKAKKIMKGHNSLKKK